MIEQKHVATDKGLSEENENFLGAEEHGDTEDELENGNEKKQKSEAEKMQDIVKQVLFFLPHYTL